MEKRVTITLASVAFVLFSIIVVGLIWLATNAPPAGLTLSYLAGLSMIFLPCTLPLVFIIVPMAMRSKTWQRGINMALLFGLGLAITLTFYGVAIAIIGKWLGMDRATKAMFVVAGLAAYMFGLSELRLLRITLPEIGIPRWLFEKGDYLKALFFGLFLGNAGVGCPNPAFYVLLVYIASLGSVVSGAGLGFIHGLGRATPLIFIVILAILGLNLSKWVATKAKALPRIMGWVLVIVGAFILMYGLFGMWWWETSIFHQGWNTFIEQVAPELAETREAGLFFGVKVAPSELEKLIPGLPWMVMIALIALVMLWDRCRRRTAPVEAAEEEHGNH